MSKKLKRVSWIIFISLTVLITAAIVLTYSSSPREETIKETMRDAVLHNLNKVSLFGIIEVNPALISAYLVTLIILIFALCLRIFAVPRFKEVPGRLQMLIELWVDTFRGLAVTNSPHMNRFLGGYIFTAGTYIFVGTVFELLGLQVTGSAGQVITLPAPLADINGAIGMGVFSYLIILSGGIISNKIKGVFLTLKEFSLPVSMSFRLFGALLSGMLVTEMVYYYINLSIVLPVVVGVLFTLLHALIQAYVLTMLTSIYYGEVSERPEPKEKKKNNKDNKILASE